MQVARALAQTRPSGAIGEAQEPSRDEVLSSSRGKKPSALGLILYSRGRGSDRLDRGRRERHEE